MEAHYEELREMLNSFKDFYDKKNDSEARKRKAGKDYLTALRAAYGEVSMLVSFRYQMTDEELYGSAKVIEAAARDMLEASSAFTGKPKPPKQVDAKALAGDIRERFKPADGLDDLGYESGFNVAVRMIADYLEAR